MTRRSRTGGRSSPRRPQDRQALDALGKLYEQTKNAKQFAEVVLRKAQLASEPVERRGLLIKAGESLEGGD